MRRVGEIIDEIDLHGKNQELVEELVALATKHGILTPYTSFLADETASVRDLAANEARAGVALDALQLESGASAFGQRRFKNDLQQARQAPGSGYGIAADMSLPAMGSGMGSGSGGGMGGFGGYPGAGRARQAQPLGMAGGAPSGGASTAPVTAGPEAESAVVSTVLNIGRKTFFWRNERWEDSTLTDEQLRAVRKIKRYSPEYFDLVTQHGKELAKYLALDETIVVVLENKAYEF
jgi:Ca-activated chloride channel family protein